MTAPVIKIKLLRKPTVKAGMLPRIPANIQAAAFLKITKTGALYTFGADFTLLDASAIGDPAKTLIGVYDTNAVLFKQMTLSSLIAATTQIEQHITAGGPVTVNNNTGIVRVDQTAGAPITLNLPAAASKTCPVKIVDWKGDSGTNNITIVPNGAEKIQGLATWTLADNNGSLTLNPIAGVGYVK